MEKYRLKEKKEIKKKKKCYKISVKYYLPFLINLYAIKNFLKSLNWLALQIWPTTLWHIQSQAKLTYIMLLSNLINRTPLDYSYF